MDIGCPSESEILPESLKVRPEYGAWVGPKGQYVRVHNLGHAPAVRDIMRKYGGFEAPDERYGSGENSWRMPAIHAGWIRVVTGYHRLTVQGGPFSRAAAGVVLGLVRQYTLAGLEVVIDNIKSRKTVYIPSGEPARGDAIARARSVMESILGESKEVVRRGDYGAWISPKGRVHAVRSVMGHLGVALRLDREGDPEMPSLPEPRRSDATFDRMFDAGWVRVVRSGKELGVVGGRFSPVVASMVVSLVREHLDRGFTVVVRARDRGKYVRLEPTDPRGKAMRAVRSILEVSPGYDQLVERSFTERDVPKNFVVAFDLFPRSRRSKKTWIQNPRMSRAILTLGRSGNLRGVRGISSSGAIVGDWLGIGNRNGLLVMPGKDTVALNKLTRVQYDNPRYLLSKNAAALGRIIGGGKARAATARAVAGAVDWGARWADASGGSEYGALVRYNLQGSLKADVRDFIESGSGKFDGPEQLADLMMELASRRGLRDGHWDWKQIARGVSRRAWIKLLEKGAVSQASIYIDEGEWIVKDGLLRVPKSSTLYILDPGFGVTPEATRAIKGVRDVDVFRALDKARFFQTMVMPAFPGGKEVSRESVEAALRKRMMQKALDRTGVGKRVRVRFGIDRGSLEAARARIILANNARFKPARAAATAEALLDTDPPGTVDEAGLPVGEARERCGHCGKAGTEGDPCDVVWHGTHLHSRCLKPAMVDYKKKRRAEIGKGAAGLRKRASDAMRKHGVRAGDRVGYATGSLIGGAEVTGRVVMRSGIPWVKLDEPAPDGRKSVRWNAGWYGLKEADGSAAAPRAGGPIDEGVTDAEDSGARGKKYERAFASCLRLAGLQYELNGLLGAGGALWDFRPHGLGWTRLPDGAPVNLKVSSARTLFTSTDFWRKVFVRDVRGLDDDSLERLIRSALRKLGFNKIWWLKAKSPAVESDIMAAARNGDVGLAQRVLDERNWSYHRISRYSMDIERTPDGSVSSIKLSRGGRRVVTIRVKVNRGAGNTAGWGRLTRGKPQPPFRDLADFPIREAVLQ